MPFTFSHPAIVLPLTGLKFRFISASALLVGSMTPDFEYFIKMKLSGRFSHTLPGAFVFCLPVGFLVLALFHLVVKRPLINSLPTYFYSRLIRLRDLNFINSLREHVMAYVACLLTGIFSHLLWDSFTHANHFMVRHLAWLSLPVNLPGLPNLPLFRYLQHLSTVAGGIYLLYFFHRMPKEKQTNQMNIRYWISVVLCTLLIYWVRANFGFEYLGDKVSSAIGALFISLILISIFTNIRKQYDA